MEYKVELNNPVILMRNVIKRDEIFEINLGKIQIENFQQKEKTWREIIKMSMNEMGMFIHRNEKKYDFTNPFSFDLSLNRQLFLPEYTKF